MPFSLWAWIPQQWPSLWNQGAPNLWSCPQWLPKNPATSYAFTCNYSVFTVSAYRPPTVMSTQPPVNSPYVSPLGWLLGMQRQAGTAVAYVQNGIHPFLATYRTLMLGGWGEGNMPLRLFAARLASILELQAGFRSGSSCRFVASGLGYCILVSHHSLKLVQRLLAAGVLSCVCPHTPCISTLSL